MTGPGDALLIDMGNTRLKWCRFDGSSLGPVHSVSNESFEPGSPPAAWPDGDAPAVVWFAAVAAEPAIERVLQGIRNLGDTPLHVVGSQDPMPGVSNGYRYPEQLGVDRLLAVVAAHARAPGPACVVDCGTAITLDFVATDGEHRGGFILPGLRMMRGALLDNTFIPRSDDITETDVLGRDTPSAVAMGTRYAVVGLIEQFVNGPRSPFAGENATLFLGGGDGPVIADLLAIDAIQVQHLVLEGLAELARSGAH